LWLSNPAFLNVELQPAPTTNLDPASGPAAGATVTIRVFKPR
jgi:hypothetical protein